MTETSPAASAERDPEDYRMWSLRPKQGQVLNVGFDRESALLHAEKFPHLIPVTRLPGQEWTDARPVPSGEGEYHVAWAIELPADSPEDAARKALALHRDPGSIACIYDVSRHDGTTRAVQIDLGTPEEVNGLPRTRPLPLEVAQLEDQALAKLADAADQELKRRGEVALPAVVRAAVSDALARQAKEATGEMPDHGAPRSVALGTSQYDAGKLWSLGSVWAVFADGTARWLDLAPDGELQDVLADHARWNEVYGGETLTVTFDPPSLSITT